MKNKTMLNKLTFLSAALLILGVSACKKSNSSGGNPSTNALTGTWNFTQEAANANISASESIGPISATVLDIANFRTINNTGTVVFTADSAAANQVGYMIDTTYTSYTNIGGVMDTVVSPLTDTIAPASSSVAYQMIGTDSIYFPSGSPFGVNVTNGQMAQINGGHFTIVGNVIKLTSIINQTMNETLNGITVPTTAKISSTITLTKQ
jgi:hypothetical protein